MSNQEILIHFGVVESCVSYLPGCLVVSQTRTKSTKSKNKVDISKPEKRYVVITRCVEETKVGSCAAILGNEVCFLELYKDKSKYKKHKPLLDPVRLSGEGFCGVRQGTMRTNTANSKSWIHKIYIAVMYVDFTIMFLFEDECVIPSGCLQKLKDVFCHRMTHHMKLIAAPATESCLDPEQEVLLSVTGQNVSLNKKLPDHHCLQHWSLEGILFCRALDCNTVELVSKEKGSYKFITGLKGNICRDIAEAVNKPFRDPNTMISPTTPPIDYGYLKPRSLPQIPDQYLTTYFQDVQQSATCIEDMYLTTITPEKLEELYAIYENEITLPTSSQSEDIDYIDLNQIVQDFQSKESSYCELLDSASIDAQEPTETKNSLNDSQDAPEIPSTSVRKSSHHQTFLETIYQIIHDRSPGQDTLELNTKLRFDICLKLYWSQHVGMDGGDWQLLAEEIGLRLDAVELIKAVVQNHRLPFTFADIVLRHWQYVYNKYGQTGPDGKCPYACTKDNLIYILREKIERLDLVELLTAAD